MLKEDGSRKMNLSAILVREIENSNQNDSSLSSQFEFAMPIATVRSGFNFDAQNR